MSCHNGALEEKIKKLGDEIYSGMKDTSPSVFDPAWWSGHLLEWAMKDESFKVQMFRFIDVFPVLKENKQVVKLLKEYFEDVGEGLPEIFRWGMKASSVPLTSLLVSPLVRKNLGLMARRFIAGKDSEEGARALTSFRDKGLAFTVDLLGEATLSEEEAETYRDRCLEALQRISREVEAWPKNPVLDRDHKSRIPTLNLSVKLSALSSRFDPICPETSLQEIQKRLYPILREAARHEGMVNLDMEHYESRDLTFAAFREILKQEEFREKPDLGIVVQSYLLDAEDDLDKLIDWAREFDRTLTVRLVKGAYWDYETVIRKQKGWKIPVFLHKEETDRNYERLTHTMLMNIDYLSPAFASHNVRSIAHAMAVAEDLGIPRNAYEVQILNGMAEPIRDALVQLGIRVRVYAPLGEMIPGMAYFVRRLLENTSNESFLRKNFVEGVSFSELIAPPLAAAISPDQEAEKDLFYNEPDADFTDPESRDKMALALEKVHGELGRDYPLVLDGKEVRTDERIVSKNPADPSETVGTVASGRREHADQAVDVARKAWEAWQRVPPQGRAEYLFNAAKWIRERRFDLAALEIYEVGKNWREADADVCEAIDFLNYYGREMLRLGRPRKLSHYPGELNHYHYTPRGIGVVISPWNFPLAIAAGMATAGISAGNCVIFKPASNSPVTGAWMVQAFRETGLPEGVLQFLPGSGSEVGSHLVSHRGIDFVAFTGSREVGLGIVKQAGVTHAGQRNVKQVIAEMGGKNAVIVDESADLDEAVHGVTASAFGFQGQKCSACSRVIVVKDVALTFIHRLVESARSLRIGPPRDPANVMGPVIDEKALQKILGYIEIGKKEGDLVFLGEAPSGGYYVPPAIFTGIQPSDRLFREEIFGPVLSIIEAKDLDEAIAFAKDSEYALTGGLFSRSPANIQRVRDEFHVGNLYINRGITGALVGRQPFGGARMSGVGSKAGGPDYLTQFMIPRTVCENTLRRGFAPPEE